jgi:hypothetical protein
MRCLPVHRKQTPILPSTSKPLEESSMARAPLRKPTNSFTNMTRLRPRFLDRRPLSLEPISTTDPIDCLIQEEKRLSAVSNQEHDGAQGDGLRGTEYQIIASCFACQGCVVIRQEPVATSPDPMAQPAPLPNSSSGFHNELDNRP